MHRPYFLSNHQRHDAAHRDPYGQKQRVHGPLPLLPCAGQELPGRHLKHRARGKAKVKGHHSLRQPADRIANQGAQTRGQAAEHRHPKRTGNGQAACAQRQGLPVHRAA